MMRLQTIFLLSLAVVLGILMQACSSPQPAPSKPAASQAQIPVAISDVKLVEPPNEGDPYRVEATIQNSGYSGQVDLTYRLRDKTSNEVIQRLARVEVQPGRALVAVAEIPAPRSDYTPEVEVHYQPR